MATLVKVVVPKVAHMWSKIALQLELDSTRIQIIKKKCHEDPEECCEEMLSYWLDTGDGIEPKHWGTLLNALEGVIRLTGATAEIKAEVVKLLQTTDNNH